MTDNAMTPERAAAMIGTGLASFYFNRDTSSLARRLAGDLRGGRKADPNVGPAIRSAGDLGRRLEALAVHGKLPPAEQPTAPRPVPPSDDLPAMLSDAGRDARYVAHLLQGGTGMSVRNVPEALRIVRALRPKLEPIWTIYETLPKPERIALTKEEQEAFWKKMDELGQEVVRS